MKVGPIDRPTEILQALLERLEVLSDELRNEPLTWTLGDLLTELDEAREASAFDLARHTVGVGGGPALALYRTKQTARAARADQLPLAAPAPRYFIWPEGD